MKSLFNWGPSKKELKADIVKLTEECYTLKYALDVVLERTDVLHTESQLTNEILEKLVDDVADIRVNAMEGLNLLNDRINEMPDDK